MNGHFNTDTPEFLPYGTWPSAITSELIINDSITIDEPRITADSIYYIERRPQESGRCVIVEVTGDSAIDILPAPFSARSRVHEYGGGSYCVADDRIFFVNDSDQDIYTIHNGQVTRLTYADNKRFADLIFDKHHQRLIAICESHEKAQIKNSIVSIYIHDGKISTIEAGEDFYASPRLNSSSTKLCWQSWNHPNMPWDGNYLWLADIDENACIDNKKHISGTDGIAVFQPQWSPDDVLYFISDKSGWWHIYRYLATRDSAETQQLTEGENEFGLPQWVFSQSSYAFIDNTKLVCCYKNQQGSNLAILSLSKNIELTVLHTQWQEFESLTTHDNRLGFIAASDTCFPQLILATLEDGVTHKLSTTVIKNSCRLPLTDDHYSRVQSISFTNRHQQIVYANYYPPANPAYRGIKDTRPPLIVICHGGPTGQNSTSLDQKKQFWTSRGFAILDVNYSGSTGYGKEYRLRLNNNWGILDVEDCCDAALYAVAEGLADKSQLIIRGSSAGGYTVLSALTFEQVFSAGASYYGISELSSLADDTHKFESHYLDRLIGPFPEAEELYEQRSPINSTHRLNCPVIFFQGSEDKVVPKAQAERMFDALNKKGLPVAAQYFSGEQHGFRKEESIKQSLENELGFYQLVFKLKPKEDIDFIGDIILRNI